PAIDAEVIEMLVEILAGAGLRDFKILLNSVGDRKCRPVFIARLREELAGVASGLCVDCQRRAATNPLRVRDCKVEADQPIIDKLPSILDYLCEACQPHFEAVRRYLTDREIEFEVKPRLVRGLDYYMRTTFEVVHGSLGAQNSVLGGGRLVMAVEESLAHAGVDLFIAPLGEAALRHAGIVARDLRRDGVSVELAAEGKLKRAMELANKIGARFTLIVGDNEIAAGTY